MGARFCPFKPGPALVLVDAVRSGRTILTFFLALLWLAMPVHCQLEMVSASALLAYNPVPEADCTSPGSDGCEEDFCPFFESGDYLPGRSFQWAELPPIGNPAPVLPILPVPDFPTELFPDAEGKRADPVHHWRFSRRAAAPVRAPSP